MLEKIMQDRRYIEGIAYGKPRKGHDEGTVENHILELEQTLDRIRRLLSDVEYWKLRVLIHVHDTFKGAGKKLTDNHAVSIRHPHSHASLARDFLAEFTNDESMLAIMQFHDEGHALWKQLEKKGKYNEERLREALSKIPDVDLYLIFTIIDGYTTSKLKDRSPWWFLEQVWRHDTTVHSYRAKEVLKLLECPR